MPRRRPVADRRAGAGRPVPGPRWPTATAVEIATGAMVPDGTDAIIRVEEATHLDDGRVDGRAAADAASGATGRRGGQGRGAAAGRHGGDPGRARPRRGLRLRHAPGRAGRRRPRVVVFGDELLTAGPPGAGRVRDSLGPQVPGWLRRLGADRARTSHRSGPVEDTLDAHVEAIRAALDAGRPGLHHRRHDARPGRPPAPGAGRARRRVRGQHRRGPPRLPDAAGRDPRADGRRFVAGLPGNPQSAIIALMTLVAPLLAGLHRPRRSRCSATVTLGDDRPRPRRPHPPGPGPARRRGARPTPCRTSARRCCAGSPRADGFAVIAPGTPGRAGDRGAVPAAAPAAGRAAMTVRQSPRRPSRWTWPSTRRPSPTRPPGRSSPSRGGPRPRRRPRRHAAGLRGPPERGGRAGARWPPRSPRSPAVYAVAVSHRSASWRSATSRWPPPCRPPTGRRRSRLCARLVDEVKARLPVWKHQVFTDGTDEWVNSP